jgi:putative chitinase
MAFAANEFNPNIMKSVCRFNKNTAFFYGPFKTAFQQFNIKPGLQQCFFLAQAFHETGELRWLKENSNGATYEGREDLGNNVDGDGAKYIGRGIFQVTGKFNYKRASEYFKVDFIKNPELLEQPEWAAKTAGWFWTINNFNRFVANYDFLEVTYRINGGYTHLSERITYLYRLLQNYKIVNPEINILTESIKKRQKVFI